MTRSVPNKKLVAALLPRRALTSAATPMIDLNPASSYPDAENVARAEYENMELMAQVSALRAALRAILALDMESPLMPIQAGYIAREVLK